ncbi:SDR family oxidoreductase [Micromonospora sp. NPDC005206]|uniref:SDR family oxidoreductase n=1 Tax=Micromonospora sp. NPDC005206 TaxID=3157022 RepID=UPI0033A295A2
MTATRRTAIVTGAAHGIDAVVVRRLSRDGFAVAVLDLDESADKPVVEEIEASSGNARAVGVDVADEQAVDHAVARVAEELGAPMVLVNNAGIIRDNLLFTMTAADWDAVMNVHLRGSFLMSTATGRAARFHQDAGDGVTANAIAPGFIQTEMTAGTAARVGVPFEDFKAAAAAQIPVGRVGQPNDIAATVTFSRARTRRSSPAGSSTSLADRD